MNPERDNFFRITIEKIKMFIDNFWLGWKKKKKTKWVTDKP